MPPLENGDHLTLAEFERRYAAMPNLKKAELIDGRVYVAPPVWFNHAQPHSDLCTICGVYRAATAGVLLGDNASIKLEPKGMTQPDICMFTKATAAGQAQVGPDGYVIGTPAWIGEIAASSASHDLGDKLNLYQRNRVREYLVWRVLDAQIDYFVLRDGRYVLLAPNADGVVASEAFPGLWIDIPALLRDNLAQAIATLQRGTAYPDHPAFVKSLQSL